MAKGQIGAEGLSTTFSTSGNNVPAGTGETAVVGALTSGGTITADTTTANVRRGTKSFLMSPITSGLIYLKPPAWGGTPTGAADAYIKIPSSYTKPPSNIPWTFLYAKGVGAANMYTVSWETTGGFLQVGSGGTTWVSSVAIPMSAYPRIAMACKIDTVTPGNSQVRAAVYPFESDTPIAGLDTGWLTRVPVTTGVLLDGINAGRCNVIADAQTFNMDEFRWDSAATDIISGITLVPVGVLNPSTGDVPNTAVAYAITSSGGNGQTVTYAMKVEYSAKYVSTDSSTQDFSDAVIYGGYTGTNFQASGSFTFTPPTKGGYRVTPYAQQASVA
jgi:hypothetical protein